MATLLTRELIHILSHAQLPHHFHLYLTQCNDRQRVIINRIRAFEHGGYQKICKTRDDWWVNEYLPSQMIEICKKTFQRDLNHLEKIGLICRNTWSKPPQAGGKKRYIYTAWGLESYAKNFLFKAKNNASIDYKIKPFSVFKQYYNFKREIEELNDRFWMLENKDTQAIID